MKHDWDKIEVLYVTGHDTLKALADRHGIPQATVRTHAARNNLKQKRDIFRASVTAKYLDKACTDAVLERDDFDKLAHIVCDIGIAQAALAVADDNSTERMTEILDAAAKAVALKYRLLDIALPRQPISVEDVTKFETYQERLAFHRSRIEADTVNPPDGDGLITVELKEPDPDDINRNTGRDYRAE